VIHALIAVFPFLLAAFALLLVALCIIDHR